VKGHLICYTIKKISLGENKLKTGIKVRNFFFILIFLFTFLLIFLVYPGNMFQITREYSVGGEIDVNSDIISAERSVMQEFFPTSENLSAISVKIDSLGQQGGLFYFNLYDKELNKLFSTEQRLRSSQDSNALYYRFPINVSVVQGLPYYYTIDYKDTSLTVCLTDETDENTVSGKSYFALEELLGKVVIASYEYKEPLKVTQIIFTDIAIIIIATFLIAVCAMIPSFAVRKPQFNFMNVIKVFSTIVIAIISIYSVIQISAYNRFTYESTDKTVLSLGVLILAFASFITIWKYKVDHIDFNKSKVVNQAINLFQIIFWAKAILSCIDFVNAGSNFAQVLAMMEMCFWFAAAMLIVILPEIIQNRVWLILLVIYTIAVIYLGNQYLQDYRIGTESYETALRTVYMGGIWVFLILRTIFDCFIHRPRFSWRNLFLTILFFVCLILFRHSNWWELIVVIPFSVFIIRTSILQENERLLNNLKNGILVSFFVTTYLSLMHRPFHYYLYLRYSGMFTTVTVTSVYLGLVFSTVVVSLLGKMQKSSRLMNLWPQLMLLGIVSGYQFLTLSRTGIMTCFGVFFIAMLFYYVAKRKESWKNILKVSSFSAISILLGFVCSFTMTRIVPAIVNDPFIYQIEEFQDSIHEGEPINSARYITINRFFGLSSERILGKSVTKQADELKEEQNDSEVDHLSVEQEVVNEGAIQETNTEQVTEDSGISAEMSTVSSEYSNGRFDIFKNYLNNLNLEGHDAVGLTLEDGSTIIHAHNSFIQMAYDCGILTGFIFIVLYIMLGFRSIRYYFHRYKSDQTAMMPMLIFAAFGIASMVEYVFRPTIPLGFVYLAMFAPLLTQFEHHDKNTKRKV